MAAFCVLRKPFHTRGHRRLWPLEERLARSVATAFLRFNKVYSPSLPGTRSVFIESKLWLESTIFWSSESIPGTP